MNALLPIAGTAAVVAYALATVSVWRRLRAGGTLWWAHAAAGTALLLHLAVLLQMHVELGHVVIGVGGALSLFAWQAALLLLLYSLRQPVAALGLVVYPAAAICLVAGALAPQGNPATAAPAWPVQMHILLSLLAYGLLTLGAVQAAATAVQHRQLHNHRPRGIIAALPPLQTMEALLFRLLAAGFFLLTLAIVSGALFIENPFAQHLVHKTVLSVIAWLSLAWLLWGRWRYGWRGRLAVRWTLIAYGILILAYFGTKFVLEWLLGEHW